MKQLKVNQEEKNNARIVKTDTASDGIGPGRSCSSPESFTLLGNTVRLQVGPMHTLDGDRDLGPRVMLKIVLEFDTKAMPVF